jgi:transposase, IS6 family
MFVSVGNGTEGPRGAANCLWRAIDKQGRLIDFTLADRRNTKAATRFTGKSLKNMKDWPPASITTDKLASYPRAIQRLRHEGKLAATTKHRTSKYLNNILEADHGALKPVIRRVRGFNTIKTASATIKGFKIMRVIWRGGCTLKDPRAKGQVRFVNRLFDHAA